MKTVPPSLYKPVAPSDFIGPAHKIARLLRVKAQELIDLGYGTAKILLFGPPGVGKTRLAEMFASLLAGHPTQIESVNGRNVAIDIVRSWQEQQMYIPLYGKFSVRIVNELDTCPCAAQDLLLTYLDEMPRNTAFVGTSNLNLSQLVARLQSRMQQFRVEAPQTDELTHFLRRWKFKDTTAKQIAVGCGGNVRAALLDAQCVLDARIIA